YDGEYGIVKLFSKEERDKFLSSSFFVEEDIDTKHRHDNESGIKVGDDSKRKSIDSQDDKKNNGEIVKAKPIVADELLPFGLNREQLQAVETTDSHVLIIAGPGTGKTHTLTYRIFYLISEISVDPQQILAVTFTNKAAQEMKNRLTRLVGKEKSREITIRTFHSLGAAILKDHCALTGRRNNFSIYDENDRKTLLQSIINPEDAGNLLDYLHEISDVKNKLLEDKDLVEHEKLNNLFTRYNNALKINNAFDYDDLIYQTYMLLKHHPEIAKAYHKRYRWISIDEYQDINFAQYALMMQLISSDTNVCAIGDPDQAIYGFRGSDYRYFLQFSRDFEGARTVHLNRNYRSTQSILDASDQIISKNSEHDTETKLWSENIHEGKLEIIRTPTDRSEAETIVHTIEELVGATSFFSMDSGRVNAHESIQGVGFSDIAVLYRLHAQLPSLEEAFLRAGIPYQAFGSVPFWEIKEVREIVSYLRVLTNPHSDIDLYRILFVPPRGIGEHTIRSLLRYRNANEISLWDAMNKVHLISSLSETQKIPIITFTEKLTSQLTTHLNLTLYEIIENILNVFGLRAHFRSDAKRTYYWDLILKHVRTVQSSLQEFLEDLSLQVETDYYDSRAEKVALMSLHAAKGLEFPIVFIAGCEDGIIPFIKKNSDHVDIDEERRLFYVGMTRAKLKLFLIYSNSRFLFGEHRSSVPSRFLSNIEEKLKEYRRAQLRKKKANFQDEEDNQLSLF
ncbi:UvrD-helicase domain-containing protein, partial [candidate division KSB1 bacterium]|nr:UvrD-helicase domain-containing protein [candidate division KSB1 bacterium]